MRNIKFDESSVLTEYAKIANEKQMIKEAQMSPTQSFKTELLALITPLSEGKYMFGLLGAPNRQVLAGLKVLEGGIKSIPDATTVTQAAHKALELFKSFSMQSNENRVLADSVYKPFLDLVKRYGVKVARASKKVAQYNPQSIAMKKLRDYSAKLMKNKTLTDVQRKTAFEKALEQQLQWVNKQYTPHVQQGTVTQDQVSAALERFKSEAQKFQAYGGLMKAEAAKEEKKYDVTGETGEDLVDMAHPGGGTKTELTHSKTDENLVETIVEQQKRDVEVAKKQPTGVYASLVELADHLDKIGMYSEANEIDSMLQSLKKKV